MYAVLGRAENISEVAFFLLLFFVRDLWLFTLEVVRHLTQSLLVLLKMVNLAVLEVAGAFGYTSVTTLKYSVVVFHTSHNFKNGNKISIVISHH